MNLNLSHSPVMVNEVISFLKPEDQKNYLDCTFGQGGYSRRILEKAKCKVFAIDRDLESKYYAEKLKLRFKSRLQFTNEKFSNLKSLLKKNKINNFDGIVIDLGISNTQLNNPKRGFSFSKDGPLDMRMDCINNKLTAEIIVNEYKESELRDIFFYYGEERNSKRIAKSIIDFRKKRRINSTKQLSEIIKKSNSYNFKHPATRVFQALRIFLNDELNELEKVLSLSLELLNKNARIIVVAFHSLEDRIIKNFFKSNSNEKLQKPMSENKNTHELSLKIITKKPVSPSLEEISKNARARSAKLRVAEKK